MHTLEVKHDRFPEHEVPINGVWCDIGGHYADFRLMMNLACDASVCEDCYEHLN